MSNADVFRGLAQDMARGYEERVKWWADFRAQAAKDNKERAAEVKSLLEGFGKEDKERAAEVSSLLSGFGKEDKERAAEIPKLLAEFNKGDKERAAEVSSLLAGFRKDSAETAAAWRDLVSTMQAKRGVAVAPPPVKPPVAEVTEEEVPVEEVVPEEKARLEEEILSLIGEHPEGIRLVEIAERTSIARIKAGNVTRMLVDEGKIRKEGLLYFPV